MMRVLFFILLAVPLSSFSQTYPELLTLPRASDRIKMEAKTEHIDNFKNFWPIMTSSAVTLTAGVYAEIHKGDHYIAPPPGVADSMATPDDISRNAMIADVWSLAWLGATYWMYKNYLPYTTAAKEVGSMPANNANEQVIRERISEEHLASAKRTGQYLNWSFALGNIAICTNLSSKANTGVSQAGNLCALSSILPIIFNSTWATIYNNQMDYRKKIYAPVASASFLPNDRGSLDPGIAFNWRF